MHVEDRREKKSQPSTRARRKTATKRNFIHEKKVHPRSAEDHHEKKVTLVHKKFDVVHSKSPMTTNHPRKVIRGYDLSTQSHLAEKSS
jgi:hypothetical protein